MEFDQETHDKILIMAEDLAYIRERLCEGKETFKEHKQIHSKHDERIRILEQNQQLLTGKIALIITGIGAAVLGLVHFLIWMLEKVMGK